MIIADTSYALMGGRSKASSTRWWAAEGTGICCICCGIVDTL